MDAIVLDGSTISSRRRARRLRRASAERGAQAGRCGGRDYGIAAAAVSVVSALLVTAAGWPQATHPAAAHPSPPANARTLVGAASLLIPGGQPAPPPVEPLKRLLHADILAVSAHSLPPGAAAAIRRLRGVRAAEPVDAAQIKVNGKDIAVLGVNPSRFRGFAAKPTAADTALWQGVAGGDIALSYSMGRLGKLPGSGLVTAAGARQEILPIGGLGTVGIAGVDGVISDSVARSLGFPAHNAIVISVSAKAHLRALRSRIKAALPAQTALEQLVVPGTPSAAGRAGTTTTAARASQRPASYGLLTATQIRAMLMAALSRRGMPYVWGAAGPTSFDCSGLVQWSFAQAGIVMPRVAADQARTGPAVSVSQLQPGDLLFYHTDPTAPGYISHVAIYLGNGYMLQAPQPGMNVEVVPADFGAGFAGAIAVSPKVAASVAAAPVG